MRPPPSERRPPDWKPEWQMFALGQLFDLLAHAWQQMQVLMAVQVIRRDAELSSTCQLSRQFTGHFAPAHTPGEPG
jgi:hypothetical protein